ncbi:unnamed protein product [Anisakis simplex]|uniref:Uncharacterized protein n=1 Tax=Anisakis simplex TaxID=6269 RepID=A0A0M3KH95_ANISI|nr:unnamed protein product [Anisakis simplex]
MKKEAFLSKSFGVVEGEDAAVSKKYSPRDLPIRLLPDVQLDYETDPFEEKNSQHRTKGDRRSRSKLPATLNAALLYPFMDSERISDEELAHGNNDPFEMQIRQ